MAHAKQPSIATDMEKSFQKSFSRWITKEDDAQPEAFASVDGAIEFYGGRVMDGDSPVNPGIDLLITYALRNFLREIEQPFGACESPIERMMLSALLVVAETREYSTELRLQTHSWLKSESSLDHLIIHPQATLGEFRVDFLLTQASLMPNHDSSRTLPGGEVIPGTLELTKRLVVECDGHDFHERSKEQASRDRARDRALQSVGYPVYRYTGSDIWKDVFHCAAEALTHLNALVYAPPK